MNDELGKMTKVEVYMRKSEIEDSGNFDSPERAEWLERDRACCDGAPGRAAMLSRAQVRACLGPLLKDAQNALAQYGMRNDRLGIETCDAAQNRMTAIHASARALLNLGPGEKSPLEED